MIAERYGRSLGRPRSATSTSALALRTAIPRDRRRRRRGLRSHAAMRVIPQGRLRAYHHRMSRVPLCFVLSLAACASTGGDQTRQVAQPIEPLGCVDRAQCDVYWQRAKVWISSNSYYRVQLSSDSVIETYGPLAGRMELAYRVLKIPDGAGGARITVTAECGNVFGCKPAATDAIVAFKRFAASGS